MLGIALLTLVPGELGGSESSTRELLRALARGVDAVVTRSRLPEDLFDVAPRSAALMMGTRKPGADAV